MVFDAEVTDQSENGSHARHAAATVLSASACCLTCGFRTHHKTLANDRRNRAAQDLPGAGASGAGELPGKALSETKAVSAPCVVVAADEAEARLRAQALNHIARAYLETLEEPTAAYTRVYRRSDAEEVRR